MPVESTRRHARVLPGPVDVLELNGAQHGFAVHDDPGYTDPQPQVWPAQAIEQVGAFLTVQELSGRSAPRWAQCCAHRRALIECPCGLIASAIGEPGVVSGPL